MWHVVVALAVAARYRVGDLGLFDYLFTTSGTLRDGLAASCRYLHLVTTAGRLRAEPGTGATYSLRCAGPGGEGGRTAAAARRRGVLRPAAAAAGRLFIPAGVAFAQPPPRSCRGFAEMLGRSDRLRRAHHHGYLDPRSARRALRRWEQQTHPQARTPTPSPAST